MTNPTNFDFDAVLLLRHAAANIGMDWAQQEVRQRCFDALQAGALEIERLRPMAESWESYEAAQARKGSAVETDSALPQLHRIDKAARVYVDDRTHGNYSKLCDALFDGPSPVETVARPKCPDCQAEKIPFGGAGYVCPSCPQENRTGDV